MKQIYWLLYKKECNANDFLILYKDDVVMGTLTVRENLMFSATLRLPSELGKNEKKARVEMVIKDLGLSKVADSKVGFFSLYTDSI